MLQPYRDYILNYNLISAIDNVKNAVIMSAGSKRRPKPIGEFKKLYPDVYNWLTLGDHFDIKKKMAGVADRFIASGDGIFDDAPDFITNAIKGKK